MRRDVAGARSRARRGALVLLVALTASAHAQSNSTIPYKVRPKDTLDVIAAEYYGDRSDAVFIVVENKIKDGRVRPYDRIRIPATREITTEKGDTFELLAKTYLGDASRAEFLAAFNSMPITDTPATGTVVTIPFHLQHTAEGNESLGQISARYFGDSKRADLIIRYNKLEKTTLEKGDTVLVPVLDVRVRPSKLPAADAEAKTRRDQHTKSMTSVTGALPAARAAWMQGDFGHVRSLLEPYAEYFDYLDLSTAIEVGILLGKSHVAYGDDKAATAAFTQVLERKPSHRLSAYAESPKVVAAWKKAGGQLQP
jgi:LysM repeat protein